MGEPRDFAADRAVCEAATKGPWRAHDLGSTLPYVCSDHCTITDRVFNGFANAVFIAAARCGWLAALDEIERLRAEVLHLSNRLRDASLGGHGSHWEGCWQSHIDCARAEVERLRLENTELRAALDALSTACVLWARGEAKRRVVSTSSA